ncbi:MAG: DUF4838 domain-containing protein [Phycisphaeraceae bacterium]|nr:DUF4838 domain-containing protein [Phycisphaeraceae bacterium]
MRRLGWMGLLAIVMSACHPHVASNPGPAMQLSRQGVTSYVIVTGQDAPEPERYAAERLAEYLHRITGATFPIIAEDQAPAEHRILVGQSRLSQAVLTAKELDSLGTDGLIVRTHGTDLLLVGGRPRGTIYAVNSFLEQDLGCRWLNMYGEEHVPALPTIELGRLDRRETPTFLNRDIYVFYYLADNRDRQNFFVGNRFNGAWNERFLGDRVGSSSRLYQQPACHTFFYWLDPNLEHSGPNNKVIAERTLKEHPDFLSLIGGQRVTTHQLCFSNSELRSTLTNNILKEMGRRGGTGVYSVSALDVPGDFCQCPPCQAMIQRDGTPGAPLIDYLVELCGTVKEKYPQAWISTLAYRECQTQKPAAGRRMPDNLIAIFPPVDRNFAASLTHPSNAVALADLKAWCSLSKHVWIWHYANPYGACNGWLPIGNLTNTVEDFRLYAQLGVEGFFIQQDVGVSDSHLLADLQMWLFAKLMWNPNQDQAALIQDFTDHFYGPAAPEMRQYISDLEQATRAMKATMLMSPNPTQFHYLTPAFLARTQGIFDRAESAASGDPTFLRRVRQARMSLDCATLAYWNNLGVERISGADKHEIARRYADIFAQTVKLRKNPGLYEASIKQLDDFIQPRLLMAKPKPLPAELAGIPEDRIRQVLPDTAGFCVDAKVTTDPLAAASICVTRPTEGELPFLFGYFDSTRHAFVINSKIEKQDIVSGEYRLYKLGRTTLNERCMVWVSTSWYINFSLNQYYNSLQPDQAWDIYVSLRFDGPAYGGNDSAAVNRVSADRVILVKAP